MSNNAINSARWRASNPEANIMVISYRANHIRNDASVSELEAVLAYAKGLL